MANWFKKLWGPSPPSLHPPWHAGQYVTYVLEYDDGGWAAFALRLLGQTNGGAWILSGDFKTPLGEGTTWFRCDPNAPPDAMDVVPVKTETIREVPNDLDELQRVAKGPTAIATLAMNLLMVRRSTAAAQSLQSPPRSVAYPCGIDQVYPFITQGPGYLKHHDLNPRVMLTGVACLSIDGNKNPMTATSFGIIDPKVDVTSYDDFVDLSHPIRVEHDGFALTYPATWFLRARPQEDAADAGSQNYFMPVGGNSWSTVLSVRYQQGSAADIAQQRDAILSRLNAPHDAPMGRLTPRQEILFSWDGNAKGLVLDLENTWIAGFAYTGIYCTAAGDRLAHVNLFGCTSKQNPRITTNLTNMESAFRAILDSFRFLAQ